MTTTQTTANNPEWASSSALSWGLEMRLLLSNCVDILYRLAEGTPPNRADAELLVTAADAFEEGAATLGADLRSVEQMVTGVSVLSAARAALEGKSPAEIAENLERLSAKLRQIASHMQAASDAEVDQVVSRLLLLHDVIAKTSFLPPDEVRGPGQIF